MKTSQFSLTRNPGKQRVDNEQEEECGKHREAMRRHVNHEAKILPGKAKPQHLNSSRPLRVPCATLPRVQRFGIVSTTQRSSWYSPSNITRLPEGTWRPTNPKKPDADALKHGVRRGWLPPYTGDVYPVRCESARLAELIREAYDALEPPPRTPCRGAALVPLDPKTWLEAYAAAHPCTDRSACFQRLVSAVYLKFGEETVHALSDDIHALSGEKYNGRLEVELARSLAVAKAHPRTSDAAAVPCGEVTKDEPGPAVISGDAAIDQAILSRDKAALYRLAPQIAELSELALSRVRLALKDIWGPGFPLREFDDVLKAERREARSRVQRKVVVKSARELMATQFPPVEWSVPGVLPVGLIALAGKQKIGKSWLDDNVGLAVASGGKAFGSIPCKQGDVLYLALEDNDRRMQERLKAVLGPGAEVPEGFYYATSWPRMDQDGLAALEDWIVAHPKARLIIIDPWVKVKPRIKARPGETGYDADYEALEGLKRLADTYHLCILVQFHLRKASAEDPFDELNGTSGITACADGFLSLKRARGEATAALWGTGRDYQEDVDLALRFDRGIWTILGSASVYALSQASREVIEVLTAAGQPLRPKEIADLLGMPVATIRKRLLDMKQRGEVFDTGKGYVANLCNGGNADDGGDDRNSSSASSCAVATDRVPRQSCEGKGDKAQCFQDADAARPFKTGVSEVATFSPIAQVPSRKPSGFRRCRHPVWLPALSPSPLHAGRLRTGTPPGIL
jgi:hypothetical protein